MRSLRASTPLFYYNKAVCSQAGLPGPWAGDMAGVRRVGTRAAEGLWATASWHTGGGNAKDYLGWTYEGPIWTFGGSYSDQWNLQLDNEKPLPQGSSSPA